MKAKFYYNGELLFRDNNVDKCYQKGMLANKNFMALYGMILMAKLD